MNDLLAIRDLRISFQLHDAVIEAVRGISFTVPPGGTVALVGESGSGKTVVSQAVLGILPSAGRIVGGEILFSDPVRPGETVDLAQLPRESAQFRQIRGGRISIIFQEPMTALSPLHTIGNQVGEALKLHHATGRDETRARTRDMLRLVGFPDPDRALDTYPFELSGGLRQRAMIAMALICRPALLIADEPTTALDVTIQAQILKLIKDLQSELGMALLVITHDLGVVANLAEEVVVMYHGRIMESGGIERILSQPKHPYLKALLRAVPRIAMESGERLQPLREIAPTTGPLIAHPEPWPDGAERAGPLIAVEDLAKRYRIRNSGWFGSKTHGFIEAVADASFDIKRGECLGLVGESGCGKTTISKIIMRAIRPDAGSVRFNDRGRIIDVLKLEGEELMRFRRKIQLVFQDPFSALNPRMTVFDIVAEPLVIHGIGTESERAEMVQELMRLVGLDARTLKRYPHSFSGGQRQRIGIARALALHPELLVCDEPVSALDVSIQAQILNLLKDLQKALGLTYLFVSHNLAVVRYVADRIAVMCGGRIVELAPTERLFNAPRHPYTRALLAAVPEPDLSLKLDLRQLMEGRASDPTAWPEPFRVLPGREPRMVAVADGHFVRADPEAASLELAS
jgi:peptide/nickel transport system ATP-binding protein